MNMLERLFHAYFWGRATSAYYHARHNESLTWLARIPGHAKGPIQNALIGLNLVLLGRSDDAISVFRALGNDDSRQGEHIYISLFASQYLSLIETQRLDPIIDAKLKRAFRELKGSTARLFPPPKLEL